MRFLVVGALFKIFLPRQKTPCPTGTNDESPMHGMHVPCAAFSDSFEYYLLLSFQQDTDPLRLETAEECNVVLRGLEEVLRGE